LFWVAGRWDGADPSHEDFQGLKLLAALAAPGLGQQPAVLKWCQRYLFVVEKYSMSSEAILNGPMTDGGPAPPGGYRRPAA